MTYLLPVEVENNTRGLYNNNTQHSLKLMDETTMGSIISRAKYQMKLLDDGYSRGDSHRKHIRERFTKLSTMVWKKGHRIDCDKCGLKIQENQLIFIHKRRSYNRYFHKDCAIVLNLL